MVTSGLYTWQEERPVCGQTLGRRRGADKEKFVGCCIGEDDGKRLCPMMDGGMATPNNWVVL